MGVIEMGNKRNDAKEKQEVKKTLQLKTTNIKGKPYVEVNTRIKAFWELYPNGRIETKILSINNGMCIMQAMIYTDKFEDLDIVLPGNIGEDGIYYGDYGYCTITLTTVSCNIPDLFYYKRYYSHSTNRPNEIVCGAQFYNEASNKVCKTETGKDPPRWTGQDSDGVKWNSYGY